MRKSILGILIVCFFLFGLTSNQKTILQFKEDNLNKILWSSEKKLTWDNFEKKVDDNIGNKEAETQCEINILDIKLIEGLPKITVGTFFVKNESWTITDNLTTLSHEQLHFDIYELYSRKIRKRFYELNISNKFDINLYQNEFNRLISEAIKENEKYDNEVYFNDKRQQEWTLEINERIKKLYEFNYLPPR